MMTEIFLFFTGLVAGTIDSIAGGGGLITLPVLSQILEPGAHAIGTNKIVGTSGALIAFVVYLRRQKLNWNRGLLFVGAVGVGSMLGSLVSPHLDKSVFQILLVAACPLVLGVVWKKEKLLQEAQEHAHRNSMALILTGLGVGFYDGFFGPGGGTFMLIGLLWVARLPLFEALLLSKLANTLSAGVSLVSYGIQGFVHPKEGVMMAAGMILGGYAGASLASKKAEKVVRPVLAFVVILLLAIQLKDLAAFAFKS